MSGSVRVSLLEVRERLVKAADNQTVPKPLDDDVAIHRHLEEFDWSNHSRPDLPPILPEVNFIMFKAPVNESPYERKLRMLEQVQRACMACTMCELGRNGVSNRDCVLRDPHVFSSLTPTRFMVVGQNPGWTEVCKREPFVGDAGNNFNTELIVNGLARSDFYITNVVKCYTAGNTCPTNKHIERCKPFLDIEINLIRPLLIATLGAVAFDRLCPGMNFTSSLGDVVTSPLYDVPVFVIYHPSSLNLERGDRAEQFKRQMRLFCGLVKHLKTT